MSLTASTLAPPFGWNPVEVLTKSAPAPSAALHARTISSSVSTADSMMTLRIFGSGTACLTAAMSAVTSSQRPSFTMPRLMTMSTSSAPAAMTSWASVAFTALVCLPDGNPHTAAGDTHTDQVPYSLASPTSLATSS